MSRQHTPWGIQILGGVSVITQAIYCLWWRRFFVGSRYSFAGFLRLAAGFAPKPPNAPHKPPQRPPKGAQQVAKMRPKGAPISSRSKPSPTRQRRPTSAKKNFLGVFPSVAFLSKYLTKMRGFCACCAGFAWALIAGFLVSFLRVLGDAMRALCGACLGFSVLPYMWRIKSA